MSDRRELSSGDKGTQEIKLPSISFLSGQDNSTQGQRLPSASSLLLNPPSQVYQVPQVEESLEKRENLDTSINQRHIFGQDPNASSKIPMFTPRPPHLASSAPPGHDVFSNFDRSERYRPLGYASLVPANELQRDAYMGPDQFTQVPSEVRDVKPPNTISQTKTEEITKENIPGQKSSQLINEKNEEENVLGKTDVAPSHETLTHQESHTEYQEEPDSVENTGPPLGNHGEAKGETAPRIKIHAIEKEALLEILQEFFPVRRSLGTLVYNPTTTWSTLQIDSLPGLKSEHHVHLKQVKRNYQELLNDPYYKRRVKYIPLIPPLPVQYANYLLEIKVPCRFVKQIQDELKICGFLNNRDLWGGASGIYTDDSDILQVLTHAGFFNDTIDLSEWNHSWSPQDIIRPTSFSSRNLDNEGDLSIVILLFPPLSGYSGFYANGVNSRSWKSRSRHSGLSYALFNVKWESLGAFLHDNAIFKRYYHEITDDLNHSKNIYNSKSAWSFNIPYYKQLQKRYLKLEGVSDGDS